MRAEGRGTSGQTHAQKHVHHDTQLCALCVSYAKMCVMTWWRTGGELLKPPSPLGETYDFQQTTISKFTMFVHVCLRSILKKLSQNTYIDFAIQYVFVCDLGRF